MTPSDLTGLPDNILRKMVEEARAEAARQALLVQRYEPAHLGLPHVVRERDEARAKVEVLLNQNREIAASNADHVRWHREKVAEIERLREALSELADARCGDSA